MSNMSLFNKTNHLAEQSEKRSEKLKKLEKVLKENYREMTKSPFLCLIDDKRLANTPAGVLANMIDNDSFTVKEKASIREKRRKVINIKTANKSRFKSIKEFEDLERDISGLVMCRDGLKKERELLEAEIELLRAQINVELISHNEAMSHSIWLCEYLDASTTGPKV